MIHGMWGGGWIWDSFKTPFEEHGYECITPTLRHHMMTPDQSPHADLGGLSLNDYVDDMQALIEALDTKPIVIGHSMGGLICQKLAERNLVEKMVLACPAPPGDIPALSVGGLKSFMPLITTWKFWQKPHRPTFKSMIDSSLQLIPKDERQSYYDKIVYDSGRVVFEIALPFLDTNKVSAIDPDLITCPSLVLAADSDRLIPLRAIRQVARKYDSEFKLYKDQSHWLVVEPGWQKPADDVLQWIEST
jgi:pimeloyl-ACP methyl ester carboxylesterase